MTLSTQCPQALLLVGTTPQNALELIKQLFGSAHEAKIAAGQHPDVHHYVPDEKSGLHPIVNIRKIIEETALPPSEALRKVFVIEEAEKMLPSSSNALLKTLEEPREDTYFFLLSHHPQQLLDTIRSRLYPVTFENNAQEECADITSLLEKAKNEEWDLLLEELTDEELEPFLQGVVQWAAQAQNPRLFQQIVSLVAEAKKAQEHHVKDRTIFLNFLITLTSLSSRA